MKNYIQPGTNLTLVTPENVLSGAGLLIGSIFGVAASDAVLGNNVDLVTEGVFELPKVSAQAMTLGAKVYWDSAAKLVTTVSAGNTSIGTAVAVAVNPSSVTIVRLNGSF
jgi:predicted RecA/RadA family phage recombinase